MSCLSVTGWTSQELRAMTGKQIEAGAKAHQYAPENVRKENRITGYRCRNFPGESLRKYFFSHSCRALFNNMGKFFTYLSRFNNFYQFDFRAFFSKKRETRKKHGFFICIFLPNPSFSTVCRGLPRCLHGQK